MVAPPKIYLFEVHNGGCHIFAFSSLTFLQDHIAWWGNIPLLRLNPQKC